MLTALQSQKLTHYFNVLDYDKSGTLERSDFTSIGANLGTLWGFPTESAEYQASVTRCGRIWEDFSDFIRKSSSGQATLEEWLKFADLNIVNGDELLYEKHINRIAREIIELFDTDQDGYISLNEYLDLFMAYRIEIKYSAKSFTKLDENGDDLISKEELLTGIREFFRSDDEKAPGNWLFGFWDNPLWV
ncbi:MAG: EF-hand domain-containing protein [Marinoscillum sp.]